MKRIGKFYNERSKALKEARDVLGLNQAELAERVGAKQSTITRLERGDIDLDFDWAKKLTPHIKRNLVAEFFNDSLSLFSDAREPGGFAEGLEPLAEADLPPSNVSAPREAIITAGQPRDLAVLGVAVGGDDAWFEFNGEALAHIQRPPVLNGIPKAYAVYVRGTSMEPRYMEGETAFVNPVQPPRIGDFVVVQVRPRERGAPLRGIIKQFHAKSTGVYLLKSLNPPDAPLIKLPADQVVSLHKIVLSGES